MFPRLAVSIVLVAFGTVALAQPPKFNISPIEKANEMLKHGMVMHDALYAWCRLYQKESGQPAAMQ
jgi:hypothetical protein